MNNDCDQCGLMTKTHDFLVQPFTSAASNTNWFLFVGLIIIAAILWRHIILEFENLIGR